MDYEQVTEYADTELRNEATPEQIQYLKEHPEAWRSALCALKKKAETQMTSYSTRVFALHVGHSQGKIADEVYHKSLGEEKVWRTGANRFLQAIEIKMMELKHDSNSGQAEEI